MPLLIVEAGHIAQRRMQRLNPASPLWGLYHGRQFLTVSI
jgi:hypothetical protein